MYNAIDHITAAEGSWCVIAFLLAAVEPSVIDRKHTHDVDDNASTAAGAVHHSSVLGIQVWRQIDCGFKSVPVI